MFCCAQRASNKMVALCRIIWAFVGSKTWGAGACSTVKHASSQDGLYVELGLSRSNIGVCTVPNIVFAWVLPLVMTTWLTPITRSSPMGVSMLNLFAVGQAVRRSARNIDPLTFRISKSLKVIENKTDRSDTYDLLLVIDSNGPRLYLVPR